jgi:hypothetical protein
MVVSGSVGSAGAAAYSLAHMPHPRQMYLSPSLYSPGFLFSCQQKIADMTANSTNSFLEAWSALVEAVRNGVVKHVSKLCHLYPSISFKVMVIGVLLAYLGTADNCRQPTYILYGKVY